MPLRKALFEDLALFLRDLVRLPRHTPVVGISYVGRWTLEMNSD